MFHISLAKAQLCSVSLFQWRQDINLGRDSIIRLLGSIPSLRVLRGYNCSIAIHKSTKICQQYWVKIRNHCNMDLLLGSDYIFSLIRLLPTPAALIALRGALFVPPPRESPLVTQKNKIWRWWGGECLGSFGQIRCWRKRGRLQCAPSVCILIYNENICFCQPYSQHKYRVVSRVLNNM